MEVQQLQQQVMVATTTATEQPSCPEGRSLYNRLVSELSLAGCEAALEHMAIRCSSVSTSSVGIPAATTTSTSSFSTGSSSSTLGPNSRHNSISSSVPSAATTVIGHSPGSMMGGSDSPVSTDTFQEMLLQMLQEEWAAVQHHQQHQQCHPAGQLASQ